MSKFGLKFGLSLAAMLAGATSLTMVGSVPGKAADPIVGLITKTNTNPFFVKMKEGAVEAAKKDGVELRTFAGKYDGDNEAQVAAIEDLISAGAKGFAIVPSDSRAIVPSIQKARAAGLLVIDLDTPMDPMNAADATYATDNFKAGELIGEWANKTLGDKAKDAKIAMLDLTISPVTVDYLRDHGFLKGFGIAYDDLTKNGSEHDARVVGHDVTAGAEEGGRKAMENLLQKAPDINVVYTINEPAAAGAYEALKAAGKDKGVLIVSIDGGCPGVKNIQAGVIGATSQQYPLLMASKAVDSLAEYAKSGKKPAGPSDKITDTGATLITDHPVEGVPSINTEEGLKKCWG